MTGYILEMRGIVKEFPGVRALDGVTFSVKKGEIHALVGENGAGKSTLMKILSGVYPAGSFEGVINIKGADLKFADVKDSEAAGIAIIYQELALVKQLSVCENIMLGQEPASNGVIDWNKSMLKAARALQQVGLNINPQTEIRRLGVGRQQLVEIAKALSKNAQILILDEPTAALSESEAENLLAILRELKAKGVTCVYISHRLKEVLKIADRITILRDGRTITTATAGDFTEDTLIAAMVGRELKQLFPAGKSAPGPVVFELKNWSARDTGSDMAVENISFSVGKGEILGVAGLVGAGRTELAMSLFGAWGEAVSGEMFLEGKKVAAKDAGRVINSGICLASEDRKRYGLVLIHDIKTNISLASLDRLSAYGVIDHAAEAAEAEKYVKLLTVKTPSIEQKALNLSGGNQQKVVLGKWLMTGPRVLILDEPTRGIDVGAKSEIYAIIRDLAAKGVAVILISSELEEILGMCDRVLVLREGRIAGELSARDATQQKIMQYAAGRSEA